MKKRSAFLLCVMFMVCTTWITSGSAACAAPEIAAEAGETGGSYTDGTYQGTATGFGGDITVEVTITDGRIAAVDILSAEKEDSAYLTMANDIIPEILDAQSADVDTISGATFSSTGIKNATAQALAKGGAR